jgi:hypothetical protein
MPIDFEAIKEATEEAGGKMTPFSQSVITQKYKERKTELYPGGICLALCIFYLSKKKGMQFGDLVVGVYLSKNEELEKVESEPIFRGQVLEIMQAQNKIKKGESGKEKRTNLETFDPYTTWMKELGLKYGLRFSQASTGTGYNPGDIARYIISRVHASIVIGIGGVTGGHAMAARVDSENIAFFDPNVGSFYIPSNKFLEWFLDYMFASQYQIDYPNTYTIVVFN